MIENKFNCNFSLTDFLKAPTIANLACLISTKEMYASKNSEAIMQDAKLDLDSLLALKNEKYQNDVKKTILLTGATGFLGSHILNELYKKTSKKIYCLVRSSSILDAKNKIQNALSKYSLTFCLDNRIIIVLGDLSLHQLGLSDEDFFDLANIIDEVYHCAASVHHIYSYEMLRKVNVIGTHELIKFSYLNKKKNFHYISTLSAVLFFVDNNMKIKEEFVSLSESVNFDLDGYSLSKLISEILLAQASKNLNIKIYRPGWILGHSLSGAVAIENNHLLKLLKGFIQLKYAPMWKAKLNILPVEKLSEMIVAIACSEKISGNVFNFSTEDSITWIDLIKFVQKKHQIKLIDDGFWRNNLISKIDNSNEIFSLLPVYLNDNVEWVSNLDKISMACNNNLMSALKILNLNYPIVDKILLENYLLYLEKENFL